MIRPLRDLLVIRPEKTPGMVGGIHLPDLGLSGNKGSVYCRVVAAGPKVELAKVGTRVLVESYGSHPAGDEVVCEGEKLTIIRERDLVGVAE
jgi:co-chaperonin GroES (HSP10)